MPASLIFPGSRPPSIVSADELNYCVRYGNRWDLIAIDTGCGVRFGCMETISACANFGSFLPLDSGITYLPRQSPAKYFRRR